MLQQKYCISATTFPSRQDLLIVIDILFPKNDDKTHHPNRIVSVPYNSIHSKLMLSILSMVPLPCIGEASRMEFRNHQYGSLEELHDLDFRISERSYHK